MVETLAATLCALIAKDIYNWLKPLLLAKFKRPKRYRVMFI